MEHSDSRKSDGRSATPPKKYPLPTFDTKGWFVTAVRILNRLAMAKAAFNKKKNLLTSKMDLNLRKKLVKC